MKDWFWIPINERLTGNSRYRIGKREELIILQVEVETTEQHMRGDQRQRTGWRDARVQDLSFAGLQPKAMEEV
jgi:hypothetical protein